MAFFGEELDQLFEPAAADGTPLSDAVIERRDGVLSIDLLDDSDEEKRTRGEPRRG
jgi:hypothetical protein